MGRVIHVGTRPPRETGWEIVQRIRLAQSALSSAIQETARTCRRLEGLRRGIGALPLDSGTIFLKA